MQNAAKRKFQNGVRRLVESGALATNIVGVSDRGLWCVCGLKDVRIVIHQSNMVSFLSCLAT